ncbi:MAG: hypothetical protein WCR01_14915 [Bacteroidota bacterium]
MFFLYIIYFGINLGQHSLYNSSEILPRANITIADGTILGGATGVSKSLTKPGQAYLGVPELEVSKFRRSTVLFRNLPELAARIDKLEKSRNINESKSN